MSDKRFRIAFSFAGEKRDYVAKVAAILAQRFGELAILYDKYHDWTGWEWMAIHAQLTKKEGSKIMLCRFEHAHVDGLFEGAAFVELDDKTPEQTATLILQRLAINEGKSKKHYTADLSTPTQAASTSTPNNLPRLQPFFGRTEELKQIAERACAYPKSWAARN